MHFENRNDLFRFYVVVLAAGLAKINETPALTIQFNVQSNFPKGSHI